jgi:hypothetical protein
MPRLFQDEEWEAQQGCVRSRARKDEGVQDHRARSLHRPLDRRVADGHSRPDRGAVRARSRGFVREAERTDQPGAARAPALSFTPSRGSTWLPARGFHAVELGLPPARVDLRTYRHDVGLSSLAIQLEREFGPERVVTEREVRALDTLGLRQAQDYRPRYGVLLGARRPGAVHARRQPTTPLSGRRSEHSWGRLRRHARGRARTNRQGPHAAAVDPARLCRRETHRKGAVLRGRR